MLAYVLACMLHLAGGHAARLLELATAIASVVEERGPIFEGDDGNRRTVALLVAIAYRESSFRVDAVGDHGASVCAFQIWHGSRALLTDARACVNAGYTHLAHSVRTCPAHPVSVYARGSCSSKPGRAISADRMHLARALLGIVTPPKKEGTE